MKELLPFQKIGVDFLLSRNGFKHRKAKLLADDMGLGKTIQALAAASELGRRSNTRILILCPHSVRANWASECSDMLPGKPVQILKGIESAQDSTLESAEILICNYEIFFKYLSLIKSNFLFKNLESGYNIFVVDEAQYLKGVTSKRTLSVLGKDGILTEMQYIWFLTGTPVPNRPIEFYPILYAAAVDVIKDYKSYEAFAYRYCAAYRDEYNELNASGASNIEELNAALNASGFMLRRMKEEVLADLPELVINYIDIQL
jgi:SNF2 family DNA or RNA helicase